MESKHMLMSALGVGIGVGLGIGLATGSQNVCRLRRGDTGITPIMMEQEMLGLVVNGRNSSVTFDQFPYYLSEQTRVLLTNAAFVHLKKADLTKHTRNLSPASRTILLSGPAETYQQMLAKALAHHFEAKLLLLDVTDFSLKIQSKYGAPDKVSAQYADKAVLPIFKHSVFFSEHFQTIVFIFSCDLIVGLFSKCNGQEGSHSSPLRRNSSASASMICLSSTSTTGSSAPLRRTSSWCFDEKLFIQTLYKVLLNVSKISPIVLYLRDIEKLLCKSKRVYNLFQKMLTKLSGSILILGSRIIDPENEYGSVDEKVSSVFPYNIEIRPPEDESNLVSWKSRLEEGMKMIQYQDNRNHIIEVLAANDIECDELSSICVADTKVLSKYIEEIVVSAISYHLMNTKQHEYRAGKLIISATSLSHGLSIFQEVKNCGKDRLKLEAQTEKAKDVEALRPSPETKDENLQNLKARFHKFFSYGQSLKTNLAPYHHAMEIPPDNEFEKRIRQEVIPSDQIGVTFADIGALEEIKESLQELVMLPLRRPDLFEGGLLKPCRGILLFGPPGTGKTMLAKAIANEAGASFINASMSTIASKWFGEDEKNVRALFSLAAKVSPTIIFVDEVDSMLGQRNKGGEHEAMRKIKNEFMTQWDGLLTKSGERILVLAATNRPFDLDEAIIRRFERRVMVGLPSVENREKILRTLVANEKVDEGLNFPELAKMTEGYSGSDLKNLCVTAAYRPVREFIQQERLKDQIAASFSAEGSGMAELKQWNELFGEGGSRKKEQLSYFL
ncbi:fidgetin-like protein 1-like [Dorcoceras hygrometricum]|uniref:Fidgetin-like protein 1-like n=1 Tax=Dorcoceras hygrometricum TaxID=472368 RepID=A0A2Z7BBS9_9LAMI|nr:fidgetin-like protein 1-like [Dorcoceras hygrometricum]